MVAIVSASSSRLWLRKRAMLHPLQSKLLDLGQLLVRVEPDVAIEDPIGPRDRLLAKVDRLGAGEAVREHPQAFLDLAPGAPRAALDRELEQGEAGELLRELSGHPAPLGLGLGGLAHRDSSARRSDSRSSESRSAVSFSSESASLPITASRSRPPG